mmetsp:Transcript_28439/g.92879  ORF Transcript_28439/g.92879 Transcript_28439/m.92879 type:complete len:239 (-) Transcript_28439:115-831(-)
MLSSAVRSYTRGLASSNQTPTPSQLRRSLKRLWRTRLWCPGQRWRSSRGCAAWTLCTASPGLPRRGSSRWGACSSRCRRSTHPAWNQRRWRGTSASASLGSSRRSSASAARAPPPRGVSCLCSARVARSPRPRPRPPPPVPTPSEGSSARCRGTSTPGTRPTAPPWAKSTLRERCSPLPRPMPTEACSLSTALRFWKRWTLDRRQWATSECRHTIKCSRLSSSAPTPLSLHCTSRTLP